MFLDNSGKMCYNDNINVGLCQNKERKKDMKKTLYLLLTLATAVGLLFTIAVCTSAEAAAAAVSVEITTADGVTYLGQQPVKNDEDEITGYTETGAKDSMAAGSGTLAFDSETGTLTMNNATGIQKIYTEAGSLTIVVNGTNEVANAANANYAIFVNCADASLTLKGTGTLTASSQQYTICNQLGDLIFEGSVKVNLSSTKGMDLIHVAAGASGSDLIFKDNCEVNATAKGNAIQHKSEDGVTRITGNAKVTVTGDDVPGWAIGLLAYNFEMDGGTLTVNTKTSAKEIVGLQIEGIQTKQGSGKITGGTINISVESTGTDTSRAYAIFGKNFSQILVGGNAKLNLSVKNVGAPNATHSSGVFGFQASKDPKSGHTLKLTGNAEIKVTADKATNGIVESRGAKDSALFIMDGGKLTGTANYVFCPSASEGQTIEITGGTIDVSAETALVNNTKTPTLKLGQEMKVTEGSLTADAKVLKASGASQDSGKDDNSGTSDSLLFAVSSLAVLSVAAAAVVIVKKKTHN